jgi:hypothetical protein
MKQWSEDNRAWLPEEFYKRLDGENQYCEKSFDMLEQFFDTHKGSTRYAQLNYCHALHGTFEIRLLPMFKTPEEAFTAINQLLNVVVTYLASCKREEAETIEQEITEQETTTDVLVEEQKLINKDFISLC